MTYQTIVVHLDTSARAQVRLQVALDLARHSQAHLRGVFCMFTPDPRTFTVMAGTAGYYEQHEKVRREQSGAIERLFRAELERAQVKGEWISVDGDAAHEVPHYARTADLVVIGQDDPTDPESFVAEHFPASVVMSAGCPVLLIPYQGSLAHFGQRIMVAWDGSREASRAVHDALPLLKAARHVSIASIKERHDAQDHECRDPSVLANMLTRHDVTAFEQHVEADHRSIGEALLACCKHSESNLIVMGGYGHTRWQELILGGATRTVLASTTVPVLMSH